MYIIVVYYTKYMVFSAWEHRFISVGALFTRIIYQKTKPKSTEIWLKCINWIVWEEICSGWWCAYSTRRDTFDVMQPQHCCGCYATESNFTQTQTEWNQTKIQAKTKTINVSNERSSMNAINVKIGGFDAFNLVH